MSRYLIVAHETAMNPDLIERVKALATDDPATQFVLLVPATPVKHLMRRSEGDAETVARMRADEAKARFAAAGLQVETRIGAPSPLDAIANEVREHPGYDGFVISTLPAEHSRWMSMDLPRNVERQYGLPVIHVAARSDRLRYWLPID
jgi:GABA permease